MCEKESNVFPHSSFEISCRRIYPYFPSSDEVGYLVTEAMLEALRQQWHNSFLELPLVKTVISAMKDERQSRFYHHWEFSRRHQKFLVNIKYKWASWESDCRSDKLTKSSGFGSVTSNNSKMAPWQPDLSSVAPRSLCSPVKMWIARKRTFSKPSLSHTTVTQRQSFIRAATAQQQYNWICHQLFYFDSRKHKQQRH